MKKLLLALILFSGFSFGQNYTISGYLTDVESGETVIGGAVYERKSGSGVTSNEYGFYSITLPSDSVDLVYTVMGMTSVRSNFYLSSDTTINVQFEPEGYLDAFEVTDKTQVQDGTEMGTVDLSMEKVKNLPALMGEKDVMKTIQLLPGVQGGTEGSSGIYVRGGGPDQNLILLDGVPVYNANHLFGFFSVFNADAINSVKLVKGGFPARYGGRLSSVIDIRMKEGNMKEFHGEGSVGVISSKLTLEGPIKKDQTSFLISARRTYIDLLAQPIIRAQGDGIRAGYFFYDVNGKINHKINDKNRLYFSAYNGNDKAYLTDKNSYTNNGIKYTDRQDAELKWGNWITALRWNHQLSNKTFMNVTATHSRYRFLVGAAFEETEEENGNTEQTKFSYTYTSGIFDWGGKVDFDFVPTADHHIKYGAGYIYHTFRPGVNQFASNFGGSEQDTTFGNKDLYSHEFNIYIEDDWKINDRLKVNIGYHHSAFISANKFYQVPQPRISARYRLNEESSLKASYSRMAQYLHLLTNPGIGLPTDLWLPVTDTIPPQLSDQVAVGYARTFKKQYEFSVEAYYKTMENIIEYKDGASFLGSDQDWQTLVEIGRGWSYGGEILLEKKEGKTTGWIGYTLSWTERQFDNLNFGKKFPYRYDRRHDIGLAVTHKFNDKVDVGMVWVYGTGNAVTLGLERYNPAHNYFNLGSFGYGQVTHIEERNNYRMPSYHRLDLGVNLHKEKKWGEATWSIGIYNVYNRQNPFYLDFGTNNQGNTVLYQYSLFPIIPSVSYSFKF